MVALKKAGLKKEKEKRSSVRERAIAVAASAESRLMEGLVGGGWER